MNAILDWMQTTWISNFAVGYAWSWPMLESAHFLGMCLLFGALLVMDLRLIGFEKAGSIIAVDKLMSLAIAGFSINLVSGIIFCFGDPHRYAINISFQLKMLFLFLAVVNFLYYKYKIDPMIATLGPGEATPAIARTVGVLSLLFWLAVLSFGRLIPYLGTG
jgi:hypothetical protein